MQCPKCGYQNRRDATACARCYSDLRSATAHVSDAKRLQSSGSVDQQGQTQYMPAQMQVQQSIDEDAAPISGTPMPQFFEYVGFWPRFSACLIDGLVMIIAWLIMLASTGVLSTVIQAVTAVQSSSPDQIKVVTEYVVSKIFPLSTILQSVTLVYFVGLTGMRGATVGKMALGMKIVKEDGSPIGIGVAIGRYLLESIFAALTCGLGYLAIAFSPTFQGWHDKVLGTVVIRTR